MTDITLITVCHNDVKTLPETFESVRMQQDIELEYIVVDGVSSDKTLDLIRDEHDLVSHWVSESDAGMYDALNKGIELANSEIVGFLHADDIFADKRVLSRVAQSFENSDVDACYGDLVYVSKNEPHKVVRYWRAGEFRRELLKRGWMPPHPTLYVRRKLYEQYGGFDTCYRIAADYDCMLRLLSNVKGKVVYIPEVLVKMRLGGISNRSFGNIVLKSWEDYRALKANGIGGLGALARKNLSKLGQLIQR